MLEEFCQLYKSLSGRNIVEPAHMEIALPDLEAAVRKCVEQGAKSVIIAPYFLSSGRHIQIDIPAQAAEIESKMTDIKFQLAKPIGIDPLMVQLIENRVEAAAETSQVEEQVKSQHSNVLS